MKIGIRNQKKNIISICRFVDQKNIFEIFKIAKKLKIYNFIVLGEGYLFDKAKIFLKSSNIQNVYLFGNQTDIFKYLYESDLFLSTSLYEGHPISILEAMSIGLPIIASNVTGNVDTIKNGYSGFLYRLGDINQASYLIEKIMKNDELRLEFSNNSFLPASFGFSRGLLLQPDQDKISNFMGPPHAAIGFKHSTGIQPKR